MCFKHHVKGVSTTPQAIDGIIQHIIRMMHKQCKEELSSHIFSVFISVLLMDYHFLELLYCLVRYRTVVQLCDLVILA